MSGSIVVAGRFPNGRRMPLFHFDDFATHVVAAIGTDDMCRQDVAALRADVQLARFFRVVRAAGAGASVGVLAFGNGHDCFSSPTEPVPAKHLATSIAAAGRDGASGPC